MGIPSDDIMQCTQLKNGVTSLIYTYSGGEIQEAEIKKLTEQELIVEFPLIQILIPHIFLVPKFTKQSSP